MNTIKAQEITLNEQMTVKAKAIYQYLAYRSNKEHTCFPALKTIARECSLSVSTVQRGIRELLNDGFIRKKHNYRENGSQTSNVYELIEAIEKRLEVAKENSQQRIRDMRKRLEQRDSKKQQMKMPLLTPAAAIQKPVTTIEEKSPNFLTKVIKTIKFRHLTRGASHSEHPIT